MILTYRLNPQEYYAEVYPKNQIYLHHTVGGSFMSTWNHWNSDKNKAGAKLKVATAYLIDVNGDVYEVFDPKYWAHHLGVESTQNTIANKQSIGIELISEGALTEIDGVLYAYDGQTKYKRNYPVDLGYTWRGHRWFDSYDDAQIDALCELVGDLCNTFKIPTAIVPGIDRNRFDMSLLRGFRGVLAHCNVREDKTDVHPMFPWSTLETKLLT